MTDQQVRVPASISAARRWLMLAVTLAVTSCAFLFINCGVFLIPALETNRHTSLTAAGLLAAMPSFGMVVTLIGWGYLVDQLGERLVLTAGSALTAVAAFAAAPLHSLVGIGALLFLGGMAAASCNAAGGRLVSGWFSTHQRGLAMGIRQTAQPGRGGRRPGDARVDRDRKGILRRTAVSGDRVWGSRAGQRHFPS